MPVSFTFGKPPSNPIVTSEPGWSRLPGYDDSMPNVLRSAAMGLLFAVVIAIAWQSLTAQGLQFEASPAVSSIILVFLISTVGHEICHLLFFPRFGLQNTAIGIWLQLGALFVQHLRPLRRRQMIVATLAPAVLLCLVPLIAGICGAHVPAFMQWVTVVNGVAVGADLLAVVQLLRHASSKALILDTDHTLFQREP
jgi:hypothetical protein